MEKAYFELLEKQPYSKITVSELIEKANVSRTTFYRHYVDIFDMYEKMCRGILGALVAELAESFHRESAVDLFESIDVFCKKLASQKKYITLLCGHHGDRTFFELGLEMIMKTPATCKDYFNKDEMFALKFIAMSGIATYVKTLMDDTDFPPYFLEISKKLLSIVQTKKGSEGNG